MTENETLEIEGVETDANSEEQAPRKLVTIQVVEDIFPIPGADAIEAIRILGWYLVATKGEFQIGDHALFFEVDAVLPEAECFEFMRSRKFRVKTAKFCSQISQGLALRVDNVLPYFSKDTKLTTEVGADFTAVIGVTKYDPEGESLVGGGKKSTLPSFKHRFWIVSRYREYRYKGMRWLYKTKVASLLGFSDPLVVMPFPSFVPKTDETRVQNLGRHLQIHAGDLCYTSEKCEGQSLTVFRKGTYVGKCSRNIDMSKEKTSNWVKMAEKYKLEEILRSYKREYAIQAEIIGPGVQGNIYELKELEIRVFYVFDIGAKRKLNYTDLIYFCGLHELPMVPILDHNFTLPGEIDALVALADGKSLLNPKVMREGIVIVKKYDDYEGTPYSFKAISPKYELDKEAKLEKARKKAEKEALVPVDTVEEYTA